MVSGGSSQMEMDYEDDYKAALRASAAETQPAPAVVADDAHPFDLDAYIANYSGRPAIDRLVHIIGASPGLAHPAAVHAARLIPGMRDPGLYGAVQAAYEQVRAGADLPPFADAVPRDAAWADATAARNQAERQKLEVELKNYTNNMIKESIRMAHRELGNFYRATGDYTTAMRHHTKSREFCTTSQHVLDMNFACLELLIEQGQYAHIATYVYKADTALDALASAAAKDGKKVGADTRERHQSRLEFASGLSRLGQGHYERAAGHFLKVGPREHLEGWAGSLMAPGDVAVYGTLCALASLPRAAIKARVLENAEFGAYVEHEPYVRELLDAYMGSRFKVVLELLERHSTRHALDLHLAPHVAALGALVRDRCLVMYLQPFASIRLARMSAAFGWPVDAVERAVVGLIQAGEVKARVDSLEKVLRAKDVDPRAELFVRATAVGKEMQSATRKLLLRLRLQQAELVVKAPKGHPHSAAATTHAEYMME